MTGPDSLLALLILAVFLGGVVNGVAGFGFSAIADALLIHRLDPLEVVPMMMAYTAITQAFGTVRMRRSLHPREVAPFCIGGLIGLALMLPFLARLDPHSFHLVFGSFLVLYGAAALRTSARLFVPGGVSGFERMTVGLVGGAIGALTALPSAAVVVWADRRGYGVDRMRGMLQPYILVIQIAGLTGLWRAGLLDLDRLSPLFLKALPALACGMALGYHLRGRLDARRSRSVILGIVMTSGALMVVG